MDEYNLKYCANNYPFIEEINLLLKSSKPIKIFKLYFEPENFNFLTLNFDILIKCKSKNFILIPFDKKLLSDKFINFINEIKITKEPLLFYIFNKGVEYIIHFSNINNIETRLLILNTNKLYKEEKEGKILSYSYLEAEISLDVIINKTALMKELNSFKEKVLNKFENVEYFEH